jgi:paraquat-inducible protein B
MKKMLPLAICFFLSIACNNSGREEQNAKADSLLSEVIKGHNVAMARSEKISQAEARVQAAIDSISRLPSDIQTNLAGYKIQLDSMDKWMEEFDMDSAKDDIQKRIEYLESEKIKVLKVRDVMINSLQKADSILRQKP